MDNLFAKYSAAAALAVILTLSASASQAYAAKAMTQKTGNEETVALNVTVSLSKNTVGTAKALTKSKEIISSKSAVITEPVIIKTPVSVLAHYSEKTYMDYRSISNKASQQYKFIQEHMKVCEDGFLRDEYGNIGVALGSYFGEIGATYEFVLDTGIVLNVVKIDEKADKDTKKGFYQKVDHSIIEFVVDTKSKELSKHKSKNGYIWSGNFNNCPDFNGKVSEIYKTEVIGGFLCNESKDKSNRNGGYERSQQHNKWSTTQRLKSWA